LNFDEYWKNLINKIYIPNSGLLNQDVLEKLSPNDLIFYQLTCIRGEIMVDGIESYFERRFDKFESDIKLLNKMGFQKIAEKIYNVKMIMFGKKALDTEIVERTIDKLLDEDSNYILIQEKINKIYLEIIENIELLDNFRMEFGIKNGLFTKG
jgi:hypothetical protein